LTDPYLQFADVAKSYDGKSFAVERLDLAIRRGEFTTFLGPSGSGKTTTLMMLAGFEQPSRGRILLDGRDITFAPSWKRNIGVVFQNYALFPNMTVAKNIGFPLRMRKVPRAEAEQKVRRVLDIVGLSQLGERYPNQLSGGQQQRVALARGLVFEPTLLLLDEPLGALDKNLRETMQIELKRIHHELGVTMIYVTHDQSEAMTLSDRVAVFSQGRIEQMGTPLELYDRPGTQFVAKFIGDGNLFKVLELDAAGKRARVAEFGWVGVEHVNAKPQQGGERWLLLRPEEFSIAGADGAAPANKALIEVEAVLQNGNDCLMVGKHGDAHLRVRLSNAVGRGLTIGARLDIGWSPQQGFVV
jgi:putative spermidine/putrescine transport system ATP-binding protein